MLVVILNIIKIRDPDITGSLWGNYLQLPPYFISIQGGDISFTKTKKSMHFETIVQKKPCGKIRKYLETMEKNIQRLSEPYYDLFSNYISFLVKIRVIIAYKIN